MGQSSFEGPGELAAAMDDFDASLIINPLTYDESKNRRLLEESLESIISGAALLADSRYIYTIVKSLWVGCIILKRIEIYFIRWGKKLLELIFC